MRVPVVPHPCQHLVCQYSVFCCSVTQLYLTLCDHMDYSAPGFPVLHYLLKLAQIHVHWVSDAIHLPCLLSSPSPPAFNLSQHQSPFQWVSSLIQVAKLLDLQLQHLSFQEIFSLFSFMFDWSPCSSRVSQESSPTPQFKSINSSAISFLYSPTLTWLLENP